MAFNRLQYASISTFLFNKNTCESPILREKKTSVSWLPSFAFKTLKWLDLVLKGAKASTERKCQHKCAWYNCCWKRCCFCLPQIEIYHLMYHSSFWKVDSQAKWWSHKSQWMGAFPCFLSESSDLCLHTSICCFLSSGLEIHLASKSFRDFYEYETNPYKSSSSSSWSSSSSSSSSSLAP